MGVRPPCVWRLPRFAGISPHANTGLVCLTAGVRRRPNLAVRGDVSIDRVLFDGATAVGVLAADDVRYRGREVMLCGACGSPAVLLRSGIGPAAGLTALDIPVVADLPVGQRLQDRVSYCNAYAPAPGHLEMTPAVGSLLWTASGEAVGDGPDLHVTATHLMDESFSAAGGAIVLRAALGRPESTGTPSLTTRPSPCTAPWPPACTTRNTCAARSPPAVSPTSPSGTRTPSGARVTPAAT